MGTRRHVIAELVPGHVQRDEDHEQEQRDDPEDLDPAGRARDCAAVGWGGHIVPRAARRRPFSHDEISLLAYFCIVYRYTLSTSSHRVSDPGHVYCGTVPKLWNDTLESHRREVRDAILDATAALV